MRVSLPLLEVTDFPNLTRGILETLQVNVGYLCNQSCIHCHVGAGPKRQELMDKETIDLVVDFLDSESIKVLDITGGAPEMNPYFCDLVVGARELGVEVIDRCNLTILQEEGYEYLAEFLAVNKVRVVASLPCYLEDNVDKQRGSGVYASSVEAIRKLNGFGYGKDGSSLILDLVYNPIGPSLPPPQNELEVIYKRELGSKLNIHFNRLLAMTNLPVGRFGSVLQSKGQFHDYVRLLKKSYRSENLQSVMCRSLISVDWQGFVYDCDFNQMLNVPLLLEKKGHSVHLRDLSRKKLGGLPINVKNHCYGCTAGSGSSCGGDLMVNIR